MSLERFKYIDGFDNKYLVSTWGNVYRFETVDLDIPIGIVKSKNFHPITPQETSKGYLRVGLFRNGKRKWYKVHRLVAQAFIENPEHKPQVNHIDGNKKNNSITNLEWVTDEENKLHRNLILDKNLR